MSLSERLMADLKDSMRNGQEIRKSTIRMVRSAIHNEEIEKRRPLTDEEVLGVLTRQVKQRRESIEEFTKGNRMDLVAKEQEEMDIILDYLPQQLSREEIATAASEVIQEVGAQGTGDFGKVMSRLSPRLKGRADGRQVSEVVREMLNG